MGEGGSVADSSAAVGFSGEAGEGMEWVESTSGCVEEGYSFFGNEGGSFPFGSVGFGSSFAGAGWGSS